MGIRTVNRFRSKLLVAIAATLVVLAAAGPAPAQTREEVPRGFEGVDSLSAPPVRDVVLQRASTGSARAVSRASAARYPVNDGSGRTVGISVSTICEVNCTAAAPQPIANFLGTVRHSDEMNALSVQLVFRTEIGTICGDAEALACYFTDQRMMVINGDEGTAGDGATREFVIAHEYGHHLANSRLNPPFVPAVAYGPKRWTTYERVCEGVDAGAYFPGNQGSRYYQNPGEAFAEAFAFARFPASPVKWAWSDSLRPDAGAFAAIGADVAKPWSGPVKTITRGRIADRGRRRAVRVIRTGLDGDLELRLSAQRGAALNLEVRDAAGKLLAQSRKGGLRQVLNYTVCGQSSLRIVVKRVAPGFGGRFRMVIRRP